jgi:hypothetical protein
MAERTERGRIWVGSIPSPFGIKEIYPESRASGQVPVLSTRFKNLAKRVMTKPGRRLRSATDHPSRPVAFRVGVAARRE